MLVNGHIDMQAEASYTLHVPAQIFDSWQNNWVKNVLDSVCSLLYNESVMK